jgi:bla regulator protein blaR1
MLQQLLADRFNLKIERPTKEMPVYALVVAKNGPKMQPAKAGDRGPIGNGPGAMMRIQRGGEMSLHVESGKMEMLAQLLSEQVNRTVLDKTGLKGAYDFTLSWTPEMGEGSMMGGPGMPPGGPGGPAPAPDTSGQSIFTALQDQLGLKLKSEKGPVQALEIVNATQPTSN